MNAQNRRWGLSGVAGALERVKEWALRDLQAGHMDNEIVHLVLDHEASFDSIEIVSVIGEEALGVLGFGPVIQLARCLRPIAAICVNPTHEDGELVAATITMENAQGVVSVYRADLGDEPLVFRELCRRDIREGLDLPFIPETYDALVASGEWSGLLEGGVRERPRCSGLH